MKNTSPEVDRYIENAAPFARPILERVRRAFHKAEPGITEVMKWSFPHFEYKGLVGSMAAFKAHATWGLWKAQLLGVDRDRQLKSVDDLPPEKEMVELIRKAVKLNEEGVKVERAPRRPPAPVEVPDDLAAALAKNAKARRTFDDFSPSHRREYVEWITEAKQEATRAKRLAQAVKWMSEGKTRNWKYER